jgi:hypothetical protein
VRANVSHESVAFQAPNDHSSLAAGARNSIAA